MPGLQIFLEGRDGLLKLFRECFGGTLQHMPVAEEVVVAGQGGVADNQRVAAYLEYAVRCCREDGRQVSSALPRTGVRVVVQAASQGYSK